MYSDQVATMLDLTTGHMPSSDPDFSGMRHVSHEYGFIVFVNGDTDIDEDTSGVPDWIKPAYLLAQKHDCILINFDRDGDQIEDLPTWEW